MQHKPVISLTLDTRKPLASGLYSIKLRATFQVSASGTKEWVRKYYPTGCSCSKPEFIPILSGTAIKNERLDVETRNERQRIRDKILEMEFRANDICRLHDYVNIELFERLFSGPGLRTVVGLFDRVIADLEKTDRVGTETGYRTARNSILKFGGPGLVLLEITPDWLRRYSAWMKTVIKGKDEEGKEVIVKKAATITTISIYLRCLRKVFNDAIEMKLASRDIYPFGARRFAIQSVRKPKVALDEVQKNLLVRLKADDPLMRYGLDFWTFSYFCNGMNLNDIARLKVGEIDDSTLLFDRNKTVRTSKVLRKIVVMLRPETKAIIARQGNKSLDPDDYVFPVLVKDLTPRQEKSLIGEFIKKVNEGLALAAGKLEFSFKLTSGTARHTFSNISLRKGASKEFIQEALGHHSIMTTENYISGFDLDTKKKMSRKL